MSAIANALAELRSITERGGGPDEVAKLRERLMAARDVETRWNPRYVSYALAHGEADPDAMLARDKAEHSACMVPFILWNTREWAAWYAEHPEVQREDPRSERFTAWQRERAERTFETFRSAS